MKTKMFVIVAIIIVVIGFSVWAYYTETDYSEKTKHETNAWVVIEDSKGDIVAVETTSSVVWDVLVELHDNQTEIWLAVWLKSIIAIGAFVLNQTQL